jgi:hypothetical protein
MTPIPLSRIFPQDQGAIGNSQSELHGVARPIFLSGNIDAVAKSASLPESMLTVTPIQE